MSPPDPPVGCPWQTSVAAFALGSLDPTERDGLAAHLPSCPTCRTRMAQVAGLPGLLARVSPQEAVARPPVVDEAMLARLLDAALAGRRTRRRRVVGAAAAAVLVAGLGVGIGLGIREAGPPGRTVSGAQGGVRASVRLTAISGGTALKLTLSGVDPEQTCRLVAIADDGHREVAGSWQASYSGAAHIDGSTALPPARISSLVVETFADQVLVTLAVPPSPPSGRDR